MQALIDGDLVAYRAAASAENDEDWVALARCDETIDRILSDTGASSFRGFISGGDNFRKQIDPTYKANRTQEKPRLLTQCQEHLIVKWNFEVTDGIEADDALGIAQTEDTIVCSLDKDLLQIPGKHYRWSISGTVNGKTWTKPTEWHDIDPISGLRNFYASSLIGDTSDNISGVRGLGPKKSSSLLSGLTEEVQMFKLCRALYNDDERFFRNLKLLWILRVEGGIYDEKPLLDALDEGPQTQLHCECVESGEPPMAPEVPITE